MRNFLIAFVVLLLWCAVAFIYYATDISSNVSMLFDKSSSPENSSEKLVEKKDTTLVEKTNRDSLDKFQNSIKPNLAKLSVFDKNSLLLYELDSLLIRKNTDTVYYQGSAEAYFDPLIKHLYENKETGIVFTSDYSANENFMTPNFGIQRGQFIKNELVKLGVNNQKISIESDIKDIEFSKKGFSYGGIRAQYFRLSENDLEAIENNKIRNFNIYPRFSFSRIIANNELKDFAKELKNILAENDSYKVKIIGHTDNIGSKVDNYQLGLKYAQQARWYLINNEGIDPKKLIALSEGEEKPIDDNNTALGRKNNLRIEFVIE
ncbi:OmpA family protein [Planktosalinus lacus]|uniref:OmpA-like domain-containing protein n=1 Tax=Planktosalinus lacus TaxID=1526573 RepID=A0A8J2VAC1_9FLAO|nr:OmpA family protein [Planktosalinus lacus]GGD94209.1 hypothetical protein GCM10011312_17420 [Planktosalinus lacus]